MPSRAKRTGVLLGGIVSALVGFAVTAFADIPALSRPVEPAEPRGGPSRRVAGDLALAWFSRSLVPATGDPRLDVGEVGGHGGAAFTFGAWSVAADATVDGSYNVDSREYPSRVMVDARSRLGTARAVVGWDEGEYGGTDLTLEARPLRISGSSPGRTIEIGTWLRGRKFERFDPPILNPAVAVRARALPLAGASLDAALSAHVDFARLNHPDSFGMVQLRVAPRADETPRLVSAARALDREWFAFGAYAFPLDRRHHARVAIGAGLDFALPFD